MTIAFEPKNDPEIWMLQAQEGQMDYDEFISKLFTVQVFLPVRDQQNIGGFQASSRAISLSLKDENDTDILVIFTSPDWAHDFLKDFADFQRGVLEEFGKLLLMNGVGYGVTINPDIEVGLDLEPSMVEQLVQLMNLPMDA